MTHSVIVETFANIFKDVDSVNNNTLSGFEKKLLRVEEGFGHPLDLLVVVMVDLAAVVKHVTDI